MNLLADNPTITALHIYLESLSDTSQSISTVSTVINQFSKNLGLQEEYGVPLTVQETLALKPGDEVLAITPDRGTIVSCKVAPDAWFHISECGKRARIELIVDTHRRIVVFNYMIFHKK